MRANGREAGTEADRLVCATRMDADTVSTTANKLDVHGALPGR